MQFRLINILPIVLRNNKAKLYLTSLLSFVFLLIIFTGEAQKSVNIINYINAYKQIAINEMQRTGIPAAITLAQGVHETQAGMSELVKKSNNHFGIKCKSTWTGNKVYHDDDEQGECFRSYDKPEESYRDHSDFLKSNSRYAFLFEIDPTDYNAWAVGLKKAGYATNFKYAELLVRIVEDYNLQQYTLIAMDKIPAADEVLLARNTSSTVIQAIIPAVNEVQEHKVEKEIKEQSTIVKKGDYPQEEFTINKTKVVFVKEGIALLTIAEMYNIPFASLLDFNDLTDGAVLEKDQLIFLQRKRRVGDKLFHTVKRDETLYDISQAEGVRMENLLVYNSLLVNATIKAGDKLYLQKTTINQPLSDSAGLNTKQQTTSETSNSVVSITHIVKKKETLQSISQKYGVSVDQLQEWNKLDSLQIKSGQQLVIYIK